MVRHTETPVHVRFTGVGVVEITLQLAGDALFEFLPGGRLIVGLIQTRNLVRRGVGRWSTDTSTG